MDHIVLLGDSIFDNAAYINGGPDVRTQLQSLVGKQARVTLLAVDGSMTEDVSPQLRGLPNDTTHIVISVGGNDALDRMNLLSKGVRSMAEAIALMAQVGAEFNQRYNAMLENVLSARCPTILCTIYYPQLTDPAQQIAAVTGLSLFNDCIIRQAFAHGLPLIDLRYVCSSVDDYANPIEPSVKGGAKIVAAIHRAVNEHDFTKSRTQVFI
jgi:hypothetical protein